MQFAELKGKSKDELKQLDQDLRRDLFNLRFQKASGELQKPSEFRAKKRAIAKIQTALTALASGKADQAQPIKAKAAKNTSKKKKESK